MSLSFFCEEEEMKLEREIFGVEAMGNY